METKICKICGIEKSLSNFYFRNDTKNYRNECIKCHSEKTKKYREENKEHLAIKRKKWQEENRDALLLMKAKYRERNRETIREKAKIYYAQNIEDIKARRKLNRTKINETARKYQASKRKSDKIYLLKCQIRHLLVSSFTRKNYVKNSHLEEIVGMNINELIKHLLQTYKNNYGYEWDGIESIHIDHKKPLKYAKTEEDIIKLCYYTNLQLLKAEDNLKKGSKLEWKIGN